MATHHSEMSIADVCARLRDLINPNVLRVCQKPVDRDLAEQLGVNRTPVREALGRLAMMGLVEARNRRGYYVSEFSAEQVSDLYEFRKLLEVHAAKLAAKNAQPTHLREFDRILLDLEKLTSDPTKHANAVKLDLEIHELIARALAAEPDMIICDEVTSALVQLVAEGILTLLQRLQNELGMSYLFITHDLATVKAISDEIVVMLQGRVVEHGPRDEILTPPHHAYTELLLSSVPEMDPDWLDNLLKTRAGALLRKGPASEHAAKGS